MQQHFNDTAKGISAAQSRAAYQDIKQEKKTMIEEEKLMPILTPSTLEAYLVHRAHFAERLQAEQKAHAIAEPIKPSRQVHFNERAHGQEKRHQHTQSY